MDMTTTPFNDLDDYIALPRVSGLAVSADGSRVVTTVAELNDKRTDYVSAIWEVDVKGRRPPWRLTHGPRGDSLPAFTSDGDLLFVSSRPADDEDTPSASLWRLPAHGGEAAEVLNMPGGISRVLTARNADATVVGAPLLPAARSIDDDRRLRNLRKDTKVTAILHAGYPVRYWDEDLGPDEPHLFEVSGPRDLTPQPGVALREAIRKTWIDVSADGRFVVTPWRIPGPGPQQRSVLVRIDLESNVRSVIADDLDAGLNQPAISPDGSAVAFIRESISTADSAPQMTLQYMPFGEEPVTVAEGWDRWPTSVTWSRDGASLIVTADKDGRGPVFAVELSTSTVTQLTHDDFGYTDVVVAPDGVLYALRSSLQTPPHPVRIDPDGSITVLPCIEFPALPGTLTEVATTAPDGVPVRSWLVLPEDTAPAPLLLWIHGGPRESWNSWSWRWNPWLMAARGYAVLLPDPGLSTGYGQQFIQRGWGAWGGLPFDDLMAATDAACAHPRLDATRTAAMGASFGGFMANWTAGHTDRFGAIVADSGLWAMDNFASSTDFAYYWRREMTPRMVAENSPHAFVDRIHTPMLVIHGDNDYRVPIGESLRQWYELLAVSGLPAADDGTTVHRFLYFPSENHWVMTPQHDKIWYEVVAEFLAQHVRGEVAGPPDELGETGGPPNVHGENSDRL
jgi:dipeptidyl aminopeptidase/acylaminoacyl peptidase